jgi:hypothetical protein
MNLAAIHLEALAAAQAAPSEPGVARIIPPPSTNFARWLRKQRFDLTHPAGFARAYVNVLRQHGELARLQRTEGEHHA